MSIGTKLTVSARFFVRAISTLVLMCVITTGVTLTYLLQDAAKTFELELQNTSTLEASSIPPFPIGVNPNTQVITENTNVESYLEVHFASEFSRTKQVTWLDNIYQKVAQLPWYQSLASPTSRILVIYAGERKEEVAVNFGKILGWDRTEQQEFLELVTTNPLTMTDGTLFPGKYVVAANASPKLVATQIQTSFTQKVLKRYPASTQAILPIEEALIVASMIEREANSFSDMRQVSGVIWKRLFTDMRLQLDATLQYARGSLTYEPEWWPVPKARDKFIDSPYNTYLNKGLPPGPISSPSAAAIIAALNPVDSDCLFYFHRKGVLYCSTTYEEHVSKLKNFYGQGR